MGRDWINAVGKISSKLSGRCFMNFVSCICFVVDKTQAQNGSRSPRSRERWQGARRLSRGSEEYQ